MALSIVAWQSLPSASDWGWQCVDNVWHPVCKSDQPLAELLYALSPEALRTGNADLNGILAAHKNVVPDIPTDEFVSAYQDAVMYLS